MRRSCRTIRLTPVGLARAHGLTGTGCTCTGSGAEEAAGADHVVGQRMPEPDRPGLLEAAHEEAQQAAVAALGVGAFGGGGAFLVDRLRRLTAHAPTPGGHAGPVPVPRQ